MANEKPLGKITEGIIDVSMETFNMYFRYQ